MANTINPNLGVLHHFTQAQELQNGLPEVGQIPSSSTPDDGVGNLSIFNHIQDSLGQFEENMHSLAELANERKGDLDALSGTPYEILGRIPQENQSWFQEKTGVPYWAAIKNIAGFLNSGDYKGLQGYLSGLGDYTFPSSAEKWLDNMVASQNTKDAQNFEEHMRDTDIVSSGKQLESLGLSSSGVLQATASHSGLGAAGNSMNNLSQPKALAHFQQSMMIGKALISMVSSMGSAGIYGKALGVAKAAAGKAVAAAAHSGLKSIEAKGKYMKVDPETYRIAKINWLND